MSIYQIVFERQTNSNAPFLAAFDAYDGVRSSLCSFVESSLTLDQVHDDLAQHLRPEDQLMILEITDRPCLHNADEAVIAWLDRHFSV